MTATVARKIGMTRVIHPETGDVVPVTLLKAGGSEVLQVKTAEKDGYEAVVVGAFVRKSKGKNVSGKFAKITEFPAEKLEAEKGKKLDLSAFEEGMEVKISGTSKGRGFSGVIKRHNFARGRETHGSHHHREPGSSGMCAKPGRILKGKKMPGHYGAEKTTFCTKVIDVDPSAGLIAVRGGVPGAKNGFVTIVKR
jgi:large subunit ribosomal protein L3